MLKKKYDWLIVGLGNPGMKYAETRHNIGWMIADNFARKHSADFKYSDGQCYLSNLRFNNSTILLAKPATYMNNSGHPVSRIINKNNISKENIIIIVDEYNFPVGKLHLKNSGSDGGHNGIASIIQSLNFNTFYRLRCGIGNYFKPGEMSDFVLSVFKETEHEDLKIMISKAIDSIETIISKGAQTAMTLINSGRLWRKQQPLESQNENKNNGEK